MGWLETLRTRWTMSKRFTLDDYEALAQRIREEDLPAAEAQYERAREALDQRALELQAANDQVALRRLMKAENEAREHLETTRRALRQAEAGAERERQRLAAEKLNARRGELARLCDERATICVEIDELTDELAGQIRRLANNVEAMSRVLEGPPVHGWPATVAGWQTILERKLYGLTDGLWRPKSAGFHTKHDAARLPGLAERARQEKPVLLAELSTPPLPPAA